MRSNDTSRSLSRLFVRNRVIELELDQLIQEEVSLLKQPSRMDDGDIFEFYLRHSRIMLLCREVTEIPHGHGVLQENHRNLLQAPLRTSTNLNLLRNTLVCIAASKANAYEEIGMSSIEEALKELVDDILPMFQLAESRSAALLQLLKDKEIVSDDELAPYLEQAANASSVKQRAARVRFESSIKSATKGIDEVAEHSAKKAVQQSLAEAGEGSKEADKDKGKEKVQHVKDPENQPGQAASSEHRASDHREPERPKADETVRDDAA